MKKSRTDYATLNTSIALAIQPFQALIGFVSRTIFLNILGVTYLGLNNYLSSLVSMLSLAELGIGGAMTYALYGPLARKEHAKINAFMILFKKLYRLIGIGIFIIGSILALFLPYIIKDYPVNREVYIIYFLFVFNSASSYFFSYKRTLLYVDQRNYLMTLIDFSLYVLRILLQIGVLIYTKNFVIYLLVSILMNIIGNFIMSRIVDRMYDYLFNEEVISITQPKLFIAENVKGLMNLKDVKEIIEHDFAQAGNGGYLVVPAKVLNAQFYGVPQSRERVIFFGFRKNALTKEALSELQKENINEKYDPYPLPTHGKNGLMPIVTCADAFIELLEPNESKESSQQKYSKAKFMGKHCQRQVEVKLDSVSPTIRSEHHGNIEYRRLSKENGGKYISELDKGMIERRLTIRECARLQTFPDDYQFILPKTDDNVSVSASAAYKIIGNAVPCVLAYNIAKNLEKKWSLYFKEGDNDHLGE